MNFNSVASFFPSAILKPMSEKQGKSKKPATGFHTNPERINRNGRPLKGYSITEMMREMLASNPDTKQSLGSVIIAKALEGDIAAAKLVWQYMDGLPAQAVDLQAQLNHSGGINVNVVSYAKNGDNTPS